MAIWTSRYSNKELQNDKYYPVGISVGLPRFRLGYGLREPCFFLAPKGYMLKMDLEPFKKAYYEKLAEIGEQKIINTVRRMEDTARREGKELVLLCFEDIRIPEDWCHRTLFAEWWLFRTGEAIKELPDPTPPKIKRAKEVEVKKPAKEAVQTEEKYEQMSLFGMAGI